MLNTTIFKSLLLVLVSSLLQGMSANAATLSLTSPLEHQVVQRQSKEKGRVTISGELTGADTRDAVLEARISSEGKSEPWQKLSAEFKSGKFGVAMDVAAGGWYRLDVRISAGDKVIGEAAVEHVGVGEVFVVAGQSNSANYGSEKQTAKSGKVVTFDDKNWALSQDPQPGAGGRNGSFMPPFGDAIVEILKVPVGFIACGIGSTSVREWLPKGSKFPNPPTITKNVQQLPGGEWESKGGVYGSFVARMKAMGPGGFRAVLWHQGESDANQKDPTRTLAGARYRECLEKLIRDSRRDIGWEAPWFVAQVSYHVPGDEASADIRDAQASLWKDGIALEGPDSDALKGELREGGGKGVHFSGPGLREHAARWADKVVPWLEKK